MNKDYPTPTATKGSSRVDSRWNYDHFSGSSMQVKLSPEYVVSPRTSTNLVCLCHSFIPKKKNLRFSGTSLVSDDAPLGACIDRRSTMHPQVQHVTH